MSRTSFLLLLPALLPACGQAPVATRSDAVAVVAGRVTPRAAAASKPAAAPAQAQAAAPERLLTVEETARIHTNEMWSEPI